MPLRQSTFGGSMQALDAIHRAQKPSFVCAQGQLKKGDASGLEILVAAYFKIFFSRVRSEIVVNQVDYCVRKSDSLTKSTL